MVICVEHIVKDQYNDVDNERENPLPPPHSILLTNSKISFICNTIALLHYLYSTEKQRSGSTRWGRSD